MPRAHSELASITAEFHTHVHRAFDLKAKTLLKLFSQTDAFRKPQRFRKMLDACIADVRGRTGFENREYPQADFLDELARKLREIDVGELQKQGLSGKELGEALRRERLALIKREKSLAAEQYDEPGVH